MKRELTDVDIQKEQLSIAIHRDTVKLEASTLQLEQVQREVNLQQTLMESARCKGSNAPGSRTFVGALSSVEEFDVVDADMIEGTSRPRT